MKPSTIFSNKKRVFLITGILIVVLGLAVLVVFNNKKQVTQENKTQAAAYCSLEFLDKVKNSTTSAKDFNKYQECKSAIIFLKTEATDAQIQELVKNLEAKEGVYKVVYISQDEALNIYKERNKDEPLLLESIEKGMLPASIEVFVTEPNLKDKVVEFANSSTFVESVVN